MHGAGIDAAAAADALGIFDALVFVAAESEESVSALENGSIKRELRITHHGAAHQQLVGGLFETAAGINKPFELGADPAFKVFGLNDSGAGNGNDAAHNGHTGNKAAINCANGINVKNGAACVSGQLAGGNLTSGASVDELFLCALRILTLQGIKFQRGVTGDQLFDLGEGIGFVLFDTDDSGGNAQDFDEHFEAADDFLGAFDNRRWSLVM